MSKTSAALDRHISMTVDQEVVDKARDEHIGKPLATLEKIQSTLDADFTRAIEQVGDDANLSKVDGLGATEKEKATGIITIHSQLAGVTDALVQAQKIVEMKNYIREGNTPSSALTPPEPTSIQDAPLSGQLMPQGFMPTNIWSEISASMESAGIPVRGTQAFPNMDGRGAHSVNVTTKDARIFNTLFQTTDGYTPFITRLPGFVPDAQRPVQVTDIIPTFMTTENSVKYMEETLFTNAAKETAEGAEAPEATLKYEEKDEPIRKISVSIPVTDEQLADVPQVQQILNDRLPFMVRQYLDNQIVLGDGTGVNLSGLLNRTGLGNENVTYDTSEAKFLKPLNALKRAKTNVDYVGWAQANSYIMHPEFWDVISLQETESAGYYLGSPQDMFMPRIWGLPVVMANVMADGNAAAEIPALVGDFRKFSSLGVRADMMLEFGLINDDFLKGIKRIKATCRVALLITRPAAFCKITRIDQA